jgi:hypothetical protein
MKNKMNKMIIIRKNELDNIYNKVTLLKLEIKNKEREMEERKIIVQKLQKEK